MSEVNFREKAISFLESSIDDFKIFIDSCSLLCDYADKFWENIIPILKQKNKKVFIPYRVCQEIEKFALDKSYCLKKQKTIEFHKKAQNVIYKITKMRKENIIDIIGDPDDNTHADAVFQSAFANLRTKYNLMLITQDKNLSLDIIQQSKSKSVISNKKIKVEFINKFGYLSNFNIDQKTNNTINTNIPQNECFAKAKQVIDIKNTLLKVTSVPKEGDSVIAKNNISQQRINLIKSVASGGEGIIYTTNIPNVVAKIYKPEKINSFRFEKISLMIKKSINCKGICFPIDMLFNTNNEFVGYTMNKAEGTVLQSTIFIPQKLKKATPKWTKIETVTLCITILEKLKYLHDRNIILGDINPNNILIVSPKEVYFVDTDSYQIEGFPCPVGTINYTAPEIQRKEYALFLRTLGNEYFAVATLLFMIMLPGKPPYSLKGGENQIDNIIKGDFAYASGTRSNKKAPDGAWRFCWSHLPRFLKDDFYETFHKNGKNHVEKNRFSTGEWLKKFNSYLEMLKNGQLLENDPMSIEIFPTRLKKNPNVRYITCKLCKQEVEEDRSNQGICNNCLNKREVYPCEKCGGDIFFTNYQKFIKRSQKFTICKACLDDQKRIYTRVTCSCCGNSFDITNGDKEYFDRKGYQLPKKCRNCRGINSSNSSNDYAPDCYATPSGLAKDIGFLLGSFFNLMK